MLRLCQGRERPLPESAERSEEHTSELQSRVDLVCRLLLEKKNLRDTVPVAPADRQQIGLILFVSRVILAPLTLLSTTAYIVAIGIDLFFFLFELHGPHRDLHSFPTRRSSD